MCPTATITESSVTRLELSTEEATALADMGRRLAGRQEWWGQTSPSHATAISVRPRSDGAHDVRVNEAVGILTVGNWHIAVQPKIPIAHLLFLLEKGGALPRLDTLPTGLQSGEALWELVALWLLGHVESVMRRDLIADYQVTREELPFARGRIDPLRSAVHVAQGRISIPCEFDELTTDNPFNRVLAAAVRAVAGSTRLSRTTRLRATRLLSRFDRVCALAPGDLHAQIGPHNWYYRDALLLARTVLSSTARDLRLGADTGWAFLVRTPDAVERGIRELVAQALGPGHRVTKRGLRLEPSHKTLNPDIVFEDDSAIADVKYKLQDADWSTSDLYQAVTFATGFKVAEVALLNFTHGPSPHSLLWVGDIAVASVCWPARADLTPEAAAEEFTVNVVRWLDGAPSRKVRERAPLGAKRSASGVSV